jgi:hypothetical protein
LLSQRGNPLLGDRLWQHDVEHVGARDAPFAATSDRFTRNAVRAMSSGGSSCGKCTPTTIASVLAISSWPSGGAMTAASSSNPKAPENPLGTGAK